MKNHRMMRVPKNGKKGNQKGQTHLVRRGCTDIGGSNKNGKVAGSHRHPK